MRKKKRCKDCEEEKIIEGNFYVNCRGEIYTRCIECEKALQRERYRKNREKILKQKCRHRQENKEKTLEQARRSRRKMKPANDAKREKLFAETPLDTIKICNKCREKKLVVEFYKGDGEYGRRSICISCTNEKKKEHYEENKEEICEKQRAYYEKHKDEIIQNRLDNIEEIRKQEKEYRDTNKDHIKTYRKLYRQRNPHKSANEKAKRRGAIGDAEITKKDWLNIMKSTNWRCLYCDVELTKNNRSIDHVIPLALGGVHEPFNLVPSCISCNSSKGDKKLKNWDAFHKLAESKQKHLIYIESSYKGD